MGPELPGVVGVDGNSRKQEENARGHGLLSFSLLFLFARLRLPILADQPCRLPTPYSFFHSPFVHFSCRSLTAISPFAPDSYIFPLLSIRTYADLYMYIHIYIFLLLSTTLLERALLLDYWVAAKLRRRE